MSFDDCDGLRAKILQLEKELTSKNEEIARLQRTSDVAEPPVAINEFEDTLKRLVQRIAMILQAEKCAVMILDRDTDELVARAPAYGISEAELKLMRVNKNEGLAGQAYQSEVPIIFNDPENDPRAAKDKIRQLGVRNGVMVPVIIEKRDDNNRILDRIQIGVLAVFNKRYGGEFITEDVQLLDRLARNAAAVIANAQMFQQIIEERQKLVHTIESLYAGLILIGGNGKVIQMNARARQIFNVHDDPAGKDYDKIIVHEKGLELLAKMLSDDGAAAPGTEEENAAAQEIAVPDPETDEERIYQMHSATVLGEDQRLIGTAFILNDITEIRNLDHLKTEFVAIAAHELRTPMTPIKGFISMLAQDEDDTFSFDERKEYYQIIEQNVDRLGRLINDLLSVTRIERGITQQFFWEEVNLTELSKSVFEVQRGMTNTERHPLHIDAEPDNVYATVGRDQLEQIVQNLVNNAIKYSPEGGEVRIILRDEPEEKTVLVGVKDSGTGIPELAKAKLFKPYRRIHNPKTASVKGTGIGLFLVKSLVEAHNGNIWVESELGKGSTFWFRLPKFPSEDAQQEGK